MLAAVLDHLGGSFTFYPFGYLELFSGLGVVVFKKVFYLGNNPFSKVFKIIDVGKQLRNHRYTQETIIAYGFPISFSLKRLYCPYDAAIHTTTWEAYNFGYYYNVQRVTVFAFGIGDKAKVKWKNKSGGHYLAKLKAVHIRLVIVFVAASFRAFNNGDNWFHEIGLLVKERV